MKKRALSNFISSLMLQFTAMGCGLIIPRLILGAFGSEVNGLVSSLNQLLSYISLAEGGLGSVVLAALYQPLAQKDRDGLRGIICASEHFFRRLASIFLIYCLALGIVYPFAVHSSFDWNYIFLLTLILSVNLFCQYLFAITYRLILEADQKVYVVQLLQIATYLVNLVLTVLILRWYPEIHWVKLVGAVAYLIQPVGLQRYVRRHYPLPEEKSSVITALPQRWACFGQNIAYFVHSNTDIVILSFFQSLACVSVYAVYSMVVRNIKNLTMAVARAFTPIIGRCLAVRDQEALNRHFNIYEFCMYHVATLMFGCCGYLITSFVMLYTKNITDADYCQPVFGILLTLSEFIYCVRDPYVSVVYAAGQFRETARGAYAEAGINIVLSLLLVKPLGLTGVAIGTCIGMLYRMLYQIWYLKKHLMFRPYLKAARRGLVAGLVLILSYWITKAIEVPGRASWWLWLRNGMLNFSVIEGLIIVASILFDRDIVRLLWKKMRLWVWKQ